MKMATLNYRAANRDRICASERKRYARIMADPATAMAEKARRKALYEKNKSRYLALSKRWREQNPERVKFNDRNKGLKRNYGISEHDYQKMHATQNGLCVICGNPDTENRRLAVDHCHETKRIRGLLCGRCNGALGWFEKYRSSILGYL